ncbi:hypothetical protein FRB94_002798 [Tulasnella sp. JGI-2019a]|nr:hypothetical protein FRB94_002798 [Tulasnella sp. JGI-2019a]
MSLLYLARTLGRCEAHLLILAARNSGQSCHSPPSISSPSVSSTTPSGNMSQIRKSPTRVERAAAPVVSNPTNEDIAGYVEAGIWGIVLFLIIASLPRAYMRWRHPSIRKHGLKLKTSKNRVNASTEAPGAQTPQTFNTIHELASRPQAERFSSIDSLEKEGAEGINVHADEAPVTAVEGSVPAKTYSRMASWGSIFYSVYRYLDRPVWWVGYSVGLSLAFAIYTGIISFGILYHNLPTFGPRRAGWIAVGQIPFIIFLSTKNNLLGFVLGVGYEKLNVWHRWVGKTMFLSLMAHVVGYLVLFTAKAKLVHEVRILYDAWIALSGFLCLSLFSLPVVRTSAYRLFWHAHWVGYILMFVGVSFHAEDAWHYAVAGFGILAMDHVCRLFKTTFVIAKITAVPELKCTRIEVPQLTRGWRAGQHVRLRAVSTQMGIVNLFESHPFTISSVSENSRGEGLVLYAKACGDWTNKLYEVAKSLESSAENTDGGDTGEQGARMRMVMEGPYGGPGHDVMSTFSSAFLVVGGSGITWGLSMIDEIIRDAELQRANVKLAHLVWVVQDPSSLKYFTQLLTTFLDRVSRLQTVKVNISVYYTRAIPYSLTDLVQGTPLPLNMRLNPGRPRLEVMIQEFADQTKGLATSSDDLSGLVIGMCGPLSLRDSVEEAQRSLSGKTRDSIGGVEVIVEAFGW